MVSLPVLTGELAPIIRTDKPTRRVTGICEAWRILMQSRVTCQVAFLLGQGFCKVGQSSLRAEGSGTSQVLCHGFAGAWPVPRSTRARSREIRANTDTKPRLSAFSA